MNKNFLINDKNCTLIGLSINSLLVAFKFIAGVIGRSQTMIADAIHSLSDGIATLVVLLSLKYSQKPADKNHPYGHENIEVLTAMFVSLLILITGIFLGYSSIHILIHKSYTIPENISIYAALASILIKEILFRYTYFVGKKLNSPMIIANAYDHRADAFSSIGALLAIAAAKLGLKFMDPVGSILISIFILKMGINILKENALIVMDTAPPEKIQNEIKTLINSIDGVCDSSTTRIHQVGRHFFIETEIQVDKDLSIQEAHKIAEDVKKTLKNYNTQIKDITIHIEPYIKE